MKYKKITLILMSIFIILIFSSSVMAEDNVTVEGKTIIVDDSSINQMNNPTIQTAINNASEGDTIEITGSEYVHCHFIVDKKLTIISNAGTILSACPSNTAGANGSGIFYFNEKASGSVLSGFTFMNDLEGANPYAVYINNASDIRIANSTIKSVDGGNGILIADSNRIIVDNLSARKCDNGILIENSNDTIIRNSEIKNCENTGIYVGYNNVNTTITNNKIHDNYWKGIYIASAINTSIISNAIYENKNKIPVNYEFLGTGIYINTSITKLKISGNIIYNNGDYGIFTSPEAMSSLVDENVEIIDGNIFYGHERRAVYAEDNFGCTGTIYVWSNFYSNDLMCPSTAYEQGVLVRINNYRDLTISNITEISDKVYSISYIRKNTSEILTDINSFDVTFFLNKNNTKASIEPGDIYRTVRVVNGTAIADFSDVAFKPGENTIIAMSPGKGAIDFSANPSRLCAIYTTNNGTVEIINSQLIGENISGIYGSDMKYNITLKEINGNPIANQNINVIINGKIYPKTTDENGFASIELNLNPGTYPVIATFCGDENYNCTSLISQIEVLQSIKSDDMVKIYKNDSQFEATFYDINGNTLNNQSIIFNINGKDYTRHTNDKGIAKMNINLNYGNYTIISRNPVTLENKTNSISVLATITENKDLTKYFRNASQYIVKVLGPDGKLAKQGDEVIFNINGVFYNRQINSSGQAKLNINLNPGEYIITGEYNGCKVSNTITVLSILSAEDLVKEYKSPDQFKVTLLDNTGNPLAKSNVIFNINGVFYTRTTNSEGYASLNINLNPGKYIITSTYNGQNIANLIEVLESVKIACELSNSEIQNIIDSQTEKVALHLEGEYNDISLSINKEVLLTGDNVQLNGKPNSDALIVNAENTIIKNLNINTNNGSGIILNNKNNLVSNNVVTGNSSANGIVVNAINNKIINNTISNFKNGIYLNNIGNTLSNNELSKNSNGIQIDEAFASSENISIPIDANTTICIPCGESICYINLCPNNTDCIPCNENNSCYINLCPNNTDCIPCNENNDCYINLCLNNTICIPCTGNSTCYINLCQDNLNCNQTICIPYGENNECYVSICQLLKECLKYSN